MKLKTKYLNVLLIILAFIALILGYTIIYREGGPRPGQEVKKYAPTSSELRSDEFAVLNTPGPDASEEERNRHFDIVVRLATAAEELNISECTPTPVVMTIKEGETLIVRNDDSVDRSIVFDQENIYPIPARSTQKIAGLFERGLGIYGYGCDSLPTAVGMFFVTE